MVKLFRFSIILEADTTIASFIEILKEEDGIVECVIHP